MDHVGAPTRSTTTAGRTHAEVDSAAGLVPFGHLGWAYRSRAEFDEQAAAYIRDGLSHGQQVVYVGSGDDAAVRARLRATPGLSGRDVAAVATSTLREFYDLPVGVDVIDPDAALRVRVAATEAAVAAGFGGFRAVVDTTAMTATGRQRAAFARFEFLIDQEMAVLPVSALCAVDRAVLGDAAAEMVCLHPFTNRGAAPFRLFSSADGTSTAVAGRVGHTDLPLLSTTLSRLGGRITAVDLEAVLGRALRPPTGHPSQDGPDDGTASPEAPELAALRRRLAQREEQLAGLPVIEQAKGLLRYSLGLDDEQAFDVLRTMSQHSNVKLRVVAAEVFEALLPLATVTSRQAATDAIVAVHAGLRATAPGDRAPQPSGPSVSP